LKSTYRFSQESDKKAKLVVTDGLIAFNAETIGQYAYHNFELYAYDSLGSVVGGMFGNSGMGWLYIDFLWLDPSRRGNGLGATLISIAEEEAKRRECIGVFLYTYSFQAPDFYEKQGYLVMGMLDDCPPGHQRIYLKKHLNL
jgi:GNAT superfamily N-acetyltransferase